MRRWAQSSQRSTWPPNAAVRQRSIADMTLSWPRLTWPAWEARQAGPQWRKMSPTSTASRDNGRASGGWLDLAQQQVERTGHLIAKSISIKGQGCRSGRRAGKAIELTWGGLRRVPISELRPPRGDLTAAQESAEGIVGQAVGKAGTGFPVLGRFVHANVGVHCAAGYHAPRPAPVHA